MRQVVRPKLSAAGSSKEQRRQTTDIFKPFPTHAKTDTFYLCSVTGSNKERVLTSERHVEIYLPIPNYQGGIRLSAPLLNGVNDTQADREPRECAFKTAAAQQECGASIETSRDSCLDARICGKHCVLARKT